ncbi:glutamate receptor 2.8-like [Rosa rugosa]|uniref:glutamate receptor 2.8-like n=1 Tax=Rosa rugosa TaxID=74645 RepID=UPI002B4032F5|nr:glutamate receptor 2.8-like [Rosa rugosa]
MAISDFYASHASYKTRLLLHIRDSKGDVVVEAGEAVDLIKNLEVQAIIIGPESSMQAKYAMNLGDKAQVPIISFSTTSSSITSFPTSYFFRVAQNDSSQVKVIRSIIQNFGWSEAVPIYVDYEFGEGVIPYLTNALQEVDVRIPYWCVIPSMASDDQIVAKPYQLMTMQTRVFIVHMLPSLGSRLFAIAKEMGMMGEGYAWITTDRMTNFFGSIKSSVTDNMLGVMGLKSYVPNTEELEHFKLRWQMKFQKDNPTILNVKLDVFGLWAYDAVWALAMAVEKVGAANFNFQKLNISDHSTNILERLGVSQSGPELVQALSSTVFRGLSGNFSLLYGQLRSTNFQIVNVNGNGEREIGYWTLQEGLVRNLNSTSRSTNTSRSSFMDANAFGPIIWPGDTITIPKGWEIPKHGNRMRVLVPVNHGFQEFVSVRRAPTTSTVSGYCIEVFHAVVERLPYEVSYEFFPFERPNGDPAGSYDDLIFQVFRGKFDAAVGDLSNRANRSLYVDFTLPYTDTGISMILPVKRSKSSKNAWVFLKPLTWEVWLLSVCFFIFMGFVVWVLEHRINKDFRGPLQNQIGTSLWFSFYTMVFAQRDQLVSNLARFVVIVWCFVVLVLTQSYTASLSSLLTVQQLQPTDVSLLLKNGDIVGLQEDSFVQGILEQVGFYPDKLRTYNSIERLHELFEQGSISAAFDEAPYMKVFVSTYCSKYTVVETAFSKTDNGFSFVFRKGSHLTRDFSRVITDLQKEDQIRTIGDKWFGKQAICMGPNITGSSNRPLTLSLDSFWGLFLIAWLSSSLAVLIFVAMFLYQHRHILICSDPNISFWRRICILLQMYDQEDINSHTITRGRLQESVHSLGAVESSASSPRPLSSHSSQTASNIIVLEMQETLSTRLDDLNPNGQTTQEIA